MEKYSIFVFFIISVDIFIANTLLYRFFTLEDQRQQLFGWNHIIAHMSNSKLVHKSVVHQCVCCELNDETILSLT